MKAANTKARKPRGKAALVPLDRQLIDADGTIRDKKTGRLVKGTAANAKLADAGAPTTYKPEYCEALLNFFDKQSWELKTMEVIDGKNDFHKEVLKQIPTDLPTLEGFARTIKTTAKTLLDWSARHPAFSDAIARAKEMQRDILVTNGLNGLYNPKFAVFIAANVTDLRDQQRLDLTSGGRAIQPKVYLPADLPDAYFDKQERPVIEGEVSA